MRPSDITSVSHIHSVLRWMYPACAALVFIRLLVRGVTNATPRWSTSGKLVNDVSILGTSGGGVKTNGEPTLKRLQQRLRLALANYVDLTEATCEIMMAFKSIPLTAKDRAQVLIQ